MMASLMLARDPGRSSKGVGVATVGLVTAVAVAGGIGFALLINELSLLLAAGVLVILIVALLAKAFLGKLDPLEPLVIFSIMWLVMFCLRPIAMLATGETYLRETYNARPGLAGAMGLAVIGALSFLIGYWGHSVMKLPRINRPLRFTAPDDRWAKQTVTVALLFGAIGLLIALTSFGTDRASNEFKSAYITYAPLLVVPASLLLLTVKTHRPILIRVGVVLASVIVAADFWATGVRFFGLLPLAALGTFYYLMSHRRPRMISMIGAIAVGGVLLLLLLELRPKTAGTQHKEQSISVQSFLLNDTTAELPALAVELETRNQIWTEHPGYLIYSSAVHWIPGGLWPNKPESYAQILYTQLFPAEWQVARGITEFSILGDFYYDSGLVGVIFGMLILGLGLRLAYEKLVRRGSSAMDAALYAPIPALIIMLLRGDLTEFGALLLYIYGPMAVAIAARGWPHSVRATPLGRSTQPSCKEGGIEIVGLPPR